MKPERRSTRRERPAELSYIQFEPQGGGIVVNASEQGLAFHAAAALRQTAPIQLCVSPNPTQRLKLTAEIVWMDGTRHSGGLRFTELTADARNQIRQWLTQTSESPALARKFTSPSCTLAEESGARTRPENGTRGLLSPVPDNAMPTRSDSATHSAPRTLRVQARGSLPAPSLREGQVSIFRPRLLHGLATGLLILLFVFGPVYSSRNFRHEIGGALIRIGEKLKDTRDPQLDASSSKPVQISNASSMTTSSVPDPTPGTSAKQTLDQSDPVASAQTAKPTLNSAGSSLADRQNSRKPIAIVNARKGQGALAGQLWSALNAGDRSAEVPLARLYLTGDGVPRSCDQARILLRAASKNGNIEALRQLQQLKKNGCR